MPYANKADAERWHAERAEESRARAKNWYEENKDRASARSKRYYEKHPDRVKAAAKKWVAENPVKSMMAKAKHRALKRGIAFNLTVDDVPIPEFCPVLGIKLGAGAAAPSIDRIDNALGYVRGNVVVISWRANRLKSDATPQELALIAKFYACDNK